MDIIVSQEQGRVPVTVFRVVGRVNLGNAAELEKKAQQAFENGMRDLLIDLTEVPSLTSAGLRALHAIYTLLSGGAPERSDAATPGEPAVKALKSPHLKLLSPSPYVLKVLRTTGFDLFMEIHDSRQDAVASF